MKEFSAAVMSKELESGVGTDLSLEVNFGNPHSKEGSV